MDDITTRTIESAREPLIEEIERLQGINAELLEALVSLQQHVPESWGDEVQNGWITLRVSADTLDEIEAAIAKAEGE